jgi:hypothetical protein
MAPKTCGLSNPEGYQEAGTFRFLKVTTKFLSTVALGQIKKVKKQRG